MEKEAKPQMYSNLGSRLASLVIPIALAFLLLFSIFLFFPISDFSPFLLTIPIALLSTLFLVTLRKKKGSEDEDEDENLLQERMQKEDLQTEIAQKNEQEAESQSDSSFPSDSESSNYSNMDEKFELNAQNSLFPSDTESINGSTVGEGFELDQSLASDNDDDDDDDKEDGLIEINLPSSHFSGLTEERVQKLEAKLPDFLPEAMFKQEGLMELLAEINEMNEEENLIEIDISMGSSNTASQDLRLRQGMAFAGDQ